MAKRSKPGRKGARIRDAAGLRTEMRIGNWAHAAAVDQGMHLLNAYDYEAANQKFRSVLNANVEHPAALHGMGLLATRTRRTTVGVELMRRAIQGDPEDAAFQNNLGTILEDQEAYEEALELYKKTVKLAPRNPAGYNNVASVMARLDRNSDALEYAREAVRLAPNEPGVLVNYATIPADVGAFLDAEPYFQKAIGLSPDFPQAHFNYSLHLLNHGRWDEAWRHYDWRFQAPGLRSAPRFFPQPVWNGRDFKGSKIIFWAEQGIGDEIWFSSMLPDAIALGGDVIIECTDRLVSLFERSFLSAEIHPFRYLDAEQGGFQSTRIARSGLLDGSCDGTRTPFRKQAVGLFRTQSAWKLTGRGWRRQGRVLMSGSVGGVGWRAPSVTRNTPRSSI